MSPVHHCQQSCAAGPGSCNQNPTMLESRPHRHSLNIRPKVCSRDYVYVWLAIITRPYCNPSAILKQKTRVWGTRFASSALWALDICARFGRYTVNLNLKRRFKSSSDFICTVTRSGTPFRICKSSSERAGMCSGYQRGLCSPPNVSWTNALISPLELATDLISAGHAQNSHHLFY